MKYLLLLFPLLCSANVRFANQSLDLSGVTKFEGKLLVHGDKISESALYHIENDPSNEHRFNLLKRFDFWQMSSFYFHLARKFLINFIKFFSGYALIDWEAIKACGNKIYLANEQLREIILFENGEFTTLDLDWGEHEELLWQGPANAGIEGLEVDCERGILYVAKERNPPALFVYDLAQNKVGKVVTEDIIRFKSISDINLYKGELYLLDREAREIIRLSNTLERAVDRIEFRDRPILRNLTTDDIYENSEKYGEAEGLYIDDEKYVIVFDNNRQYYLPDIVQLLGSKENFPMYLTLSKY
jgi:hypothetical protein